MIYLKLSKSQKKEFQNNGFIKVPNVFYKNLMSESLPFIWFNLNLCARQVGCSLEEYLSVISRWVARSPIVKDFDPFIYKATAVLIESFIGPAQLIKTNVISKTPHAFRRLAFHQDISYSPETPYDITAWVMLTDCPKESGCLEFIKGSHTNGIFPAVDFWAPDFVDTVYKKYKDSPDRVSVTGSAGDLILFDSRIFHASSKNTNGSYRFSLVTRWRGKSPYITEKIPPIKPRKNGMWTAADDIKKFLEHNLQSVYKKIPPKEYCDLVTTYIRCLETDTHSSAANKEDVIKALKNSIILHKGHLLHNGGDAQGIHYKSLFQAIHKLKIRKKNQSYITELCSHIDL